MTIPESFESLRLVRARKRLAVRPGATIAGPLPRDPSTAEIELLVARAQKRLIDRSDRDARVSA